MAVRRRPSARRTSASSSARGRRRRRSSAATKRSTTASTPAPAERAGDDRIGRRMIVNCAAYSGGCRIADIPLDQVGEWAARDGHFVWIGLFEPSEEEMRLVQAELGLHDLAVEDAHRAHQRPKLEEYGDGLFVVLRTVLWNTEKRSFERGETHVFVGPRYVVSIRHGETGSYTPVRGRCEATPGHLALGPGFVLYAIMDFVV